MGSVCDPFGWLSDHKVPSVPEPEKNLKLVKCPVGSGRFVIFSTSKMKVLASENKLVPNSTTHCWKSLKLSAFPFKIWLIMDGIGSFVRNYITPPTGRIGIEVILFCGILTKMVKLLKCQSQSLTFSFTFPFSPLGRSPSPTFTDWYNSLFFASWMKFPHSTSNVIYPKNLSGDCKLLVENWAPHLPLFTCGIHLLRPLPKVSRRRPSPLTPPQSTATWHLPTSAFVHFLLG